MTIAYSNIQRLAAEFVGTAFLLATVVGSGIMAEALTGDIALALLANTIATGAILYVLITLFGSVSGAHFNPAVTLAFAMEKTISARESALFVVAQIIGAVIGVWMAHLMFDQSVFQLSEKIRAGSAQGFSEGIATFGLVLAILGAVRVNIVAVPAVVGLYITAAYWFTASTSFANPAVTFARAMSNTFAGIRPLDAPLFIAVQLVGSVFAVLVFRLIFGRER